jgi:serine/threonine protein kinase/formylglycine-generating enzyme required for sulfatase activity
MSELTLLVAELENGSTDLANCLSSRPDLSREDQLLLVLADQKYRVQRNEPCSAEHYAQLLPWLATEPQRQQQLIASEFALRLGSEAPDSLLQQFGSRYRDFGVPLATLLREQVERWNVQPLDPKHFDRLCDEFEEACGAGTFSAIESYLQRAPAAWHPELLRELIRIETYHLTQAGKPIEWNDYPRRFPNYAEFIRLVQRQHVNTNPPRSQRATTTQPVPHAGNPNDLTGTFISSHTVGDLRNGRYRFVRKLGQGAYGAVYLAQDMDLKRRVAVKVPSREALAKMVDIDSYLVEAQTVAALDHPRIVTVYDVGRTLDGSIYVVSKFIDGCSLAEWIKKTTLDFQAIAKLLEPIAEALQHAHQRRLIHRDIKPANILIEESTGTPYVADFGLAIREEDYLLDNRIAGTPSYMSPEQVRGEGHRLDGRSDLFSLGVVMYQMLTGRLPFPGQTRAEIAHEITSLEPPAPRSLITDIPAELERICLKLLRKRASERYANGRELAKDLRAWLTPRAIQLAKTAIQKITPRGLRSFTADDAGFFLDLLPGPRNRDGLPESIAFWKERIEQRDPDQTFTVGLLYGPSGCGKSSLVKAGLIPSLSAEVIAIYIEATPEETESRLLRQLRKRIPELPTELGLAETAERIRRSDGPKVVLLIDQFEQWLYSHRVDQEGDLVRALRQCDGGRLQAILMIRDDFYLAAARLMNLIDVPIVTDQNFKLVDLFDTEHAKRVLVRFGESYDKFPMDATTRSPDQTAFIDQVIDGLSENSKVVSVRLSLLADMLKGRDWVPSTLDAIGGLDGIGISFLEETFASSRADARHRAHQVAVRGILRALLPELGTDIKGSMRSEEELLEASEYANRRQDFQDLMRILDGELRLLTPTDPEGHDSQSGSDAPPRRYYQLTHDYLVPSLREWLTRKQRETKKGRAELKLAERAAAWGVNRESKQLPTLVEWFQIRRLTEPAKWKANEKAVMQQATRHHMQRIALTTAAVALLASGSWFAWRESTRRQEATRIAGLVDTLTNAEPAQIPEIVKQLNANPQVAQVAEEYLTPKLSADGKTPGEQRARLHSRLASVARDPSLVEPLVEELVTGKVNYVLPIRQLLKPSAAKLSESLQSLLKDDKADPQRRFRAALALADYVPPSDEATWTESNRAFVAQQLVSSNAEYQPILREALRPIQSQLLGDLERIFAASPGDAQRLSAANALADYAANDRERLTKLLTQATPEQYAVIYPLVSAVPSPENISQLSQVAATPPPEDLGSFARIAYGQQRANAAVTMLKLGEKEKVLPVFDWTDDPEAMTQFIFRCKPRGISVDNLLDLLEFTTRSVSEGSDAAASGLTSSTSLAHASGWDRARYALLLAIGEYAPTDIPASRRDALVKQLADWYANDPNSGVHGASGWLLRHLGENEIATRIDQTPVPYSPDREWFTLAITVKPTPPPKPKPEEKEEEGAEPSEGKEEESDENKTEPNEPEPPPEPLPPKTFYYTFIVHPKGEYMISSVEDEDGRFKNNEVRHTVTLTRPFALLDREITFDELIAFSPQYAGIMQQRDAAFVDAGFGAHWYESVAFCRWLGTEMGLAETDQCYADPETLDKEQYPRDPQETSFPQNWPLDLSKRGFRLPTESEWEVMARSGSRTAYGFGSEVALLDRFGWFTENSGKKVHPGREKRPSVRGLFDLHGNLFEWTHDWDGEFGTSAQTDPLGAKTGSGRVYRGGGWGFDAARCRAAFRYPNPQAYRTSNYGFRVALSPSIQSLEAEDETRAEPAGGGTEGGSGARPEMP